MNAVASVTEAIVMGAIGNPDDAMAPATINRGDTPSALLTLFEDTPSQPPSTKRKNAMRGFVPQSGFLMSTRNAYVRSGSVDEKQMVKEVRARRDWVFWHFDKTGKKQTKGSDSNKDITTGGDG